MNDLEDGFMGVDLLEHNQEAFQEINKMIESGIKKIAAPRATGSGKTYLMGALAEKYNDEPKLVLEPTRPLLDSIKEKFDEFGITNTDFITYQKLIRMSDEDIAEMDYKLIFLDECHHGTAPVWSQKINYLMESHSDSIILGTSATTVRNDGVNVVETIFEGNAIGELPLSTAIARKVLPCPHYISTIYRLDDELDKLKKKIENATNTKAEKKEFYKKMQTMKLHFEKSYGVPLILNKYIKVKNGKYLVFCKDKKHLDTMRDVVIDWFHTAGMKNVHSYAVYSDYPDKEKDYKDFCEDNSEALKVLFSINMLNEGLHIEDISGVLMLRTTQSNLIYLQQLGRLVETENMGKYLLVFDFVNNFSSVNDGAGLLREIKDAIAREKESDPNFDDSGFDNIDTFFVVDQIVEIQEMFREIEGRLKDNWDLMFQEYCKFYEKNGHGDVPKTEEYRKLNNWCINQRYNLVNGILNENRKNLLDEKNFIWNVYRYRFERRIIEASKYYEKFGMYPLSGHMEDSEIRKLGNYIYDEKKNMRNKNESYPEWKREIIKKYLPDFSCETQEEKLFNEFFYYAKLYKERYGHVDIKHKDIINSFPIGRKLSAIKQKKNISKANLNQLKELGISLENKYKKEFIRKMELVRQALNDDIIITRKNQSYKGVNLYLWITHHKKDFSDEELKAVNQLMPFDSQNVQIRIFDITNHSYKEYVSMSEAGRALCNEFHVVDSDKKGLGIIYGRLSGKIKNPIYKGRFRFEYADK